MNTSLTMKNDVPRLPPPAPELQLLNIFVGKWHSEGNLYDGQELENNPGAPLVKWVSDETYEWMSGKYFLIHRWEAKVGGIVFKGMEIIGYDVERKEFFSRMFTQEGHVTKFKATVENQTWFFTEPSRRTTLLFADDGNSIAMKSEWRHEGGDWLPLNTRIARRMPKNL